MFRRLPDDNFFENIDPMTKLWMYESWIKDEEEKHKFARDYSVFIGSFYNPEAAKQAMSQENPNYSLSEKEEEETMQKVLAARPKPLTRRQRRQIKKVIK